MTDPAGVSRGISTIVYLGGAGDEGGDGEADGLGGNVLAGAGLDAGGGMAAGGLGLEDDEGSGFAGRLAAAAPELTEEPEELPDPPPHDAQIAAARMMAADLMAAPPSPIP